MGSIQVTLVMPDDENDVETVVGVFYGPESETLADLFIKEAAETNTWLGTSPSDFKKVTLPATDHLAPAMVQSNRTTQVGEDGTEVGHTLNQTTLPIEPGVRRTDVHHSVLVVRGNPKGQRVPADNWYKILSVNTNVVTDDPDTRERAALEHRQLVERVQAHHASLISEPVGTRLVPDRLPPVED